MRAAFLILALSAAGLSLESDADVPGSAGLKDSRSPVLIELFTAEGCSSCPPADAFVKQLDALQPIAGAQLIVLGEHVDYWDNQGWRDPYSSAALTDRQRGYAHALGRRETYTPQLIVDAVSEMRLSERQKISQILEAAATSPKIPVAIDSLRTEAPGRVSGIISVDADAQHRKGAVYVGIALDHFESKVLRGENRGQTLTHVAVLLDLDKLGPLAPGEKFSREFQVPVKAGVDPGNLRVIAFVQESDYGKVVGAALKRTASGPG